MSHREPRLDDSSRVPSHWIGIATAWRDDPSRVSDYLVSLPPAQLATHALVIGSTGSGKTNLLHHLIAQDILLGHSFAVLDLRGDLISSVLELCAGRVDPSRISLLDLREKSEVAGFNPLYGAGEPYFRALSVLDVLAQESESWGVQLAESLRNALLLLAEAGAPLTFLEHVFYDADFRAQMLEHSSCDDVRGFWMRYGELSKERQNTLAMPVLNKVSLLLATPTIRKMLGHPSPIDLGAHINRTGSVTLVSLAADELHGAGRMMGSLVLAALSREIFSRVTTAEPRRNPIRLYIDEFEHFGLSDVEAMLAEGRKFKVSLVLAHQTLAQLSPRMRSMILGNVGVKVLFRCGREGAATLCKDLFGEPKGYDLCALPIGQAILWTRGDGAVEIEVNEPLLRNIGSLSGPARTFAAAVRSYADRGVPVQRDWPKPKPKARRPEPPQAEPPLVKAGKVPRPQKTHVDLEDWLCG